MPGRARILPIVALLALVAGCGGGDDDRFGTFTDCATVGRPASVDDPRGDATGTDAGAEAPQGDLLGLRVARGGGRLCAEFRAAGAIRPSAAYALALRPTGAETPVVQVQATVLAGTSPEARISSALGGEFEKVDADVGIDGDRLTVVVDRAAFAQRGLTRIFDAFRFQGRVAVALKDDQRVADCLPACR